MARRKNLSQDDFRNVTRMVEANVISPDQGVEMLSFALKTERDARAQQALIAQAQAQAARANPPQFYNKSTMNKQRVQERNEQIALYARLASSGLPADASLAEKMLPLLAAEEEAYRAAVREGRTRYNASPSLVEQAASQYTALFGQPAQAHGADRILAWEDRAAVLAAGGRPRPASWAGTPSVYRVDADFLNRLLWLAKKDPRGSQRDMQHALAPWFEGFQKTKRPRAKA